MSVITFVNNRKEETGKTLSLVAIATNMAIENNEKILIISTTNKESKIKSCFFEDTEVKKMRLGIFGQNMSALDTEAGIDGLAKMLRSNKLNPDMITNYTKVVFKDRLEVLLGKNKSESNQNIEEKVRSSPIEIADEYVEIVKIANQYYDKVFVDLDYNLNQDIREQIIDQSDLIILNSSQNYKSLKELKENKENNKLLKSPRTLLLIGRYDKYSKYNVKNITRYLGEKNKVLTVPYNTLYFEACNEAGVPDLFLKLKKMYDLDDRNAIFMEEIKRASENIIYRLQELQTIM
ncbi:MAG: hypothetical protein BHW00_05465 [Clostridium sp. 26_22]|nr:MAG: hypothetical protein BHW00_05465 [Clostridium sp. 26_22]